MIKYYPLALAVKGRPTLIVGGGQVAERKALSLLASGARVKIISPRLTAKLKQMSERKRISWFPREVRKRDIYNANLIIAATDNPGLNKSVSKWSGKNVLVNVVDKPNLSNFISPAVLRRDKAIIAVYTDGRDPVLSRDLKNYIKENWDEFISYRKRLQKR